MADPALALAGLRERFAAVRGQIEASARRANRSPEEITLVAVSKTHGLETLRSALDLGITDLDSDDLVRRLNRLCAEEGRAELPLLIQLDLAGERTKSGIGEDDLADLAATIGGCEHLRLVGLMTLPPFFEEAERARPFFKRLRELRDALQAKGCFGDRAGELSMGMTHDFEIAIEEGASMVRIGTALFGERKPNE